MGSQQIASIVDGSITAAALFGLVVGTVFTCLPIFVLWAGVRFRTSRRTIVGWIGLFCLAIVTAAPNLLTLWVAYGGDTASTAGQRTLDVEAPGFRMWTAIGAIAGLVIGAFFLNLARTKRKAKKQAEALAKEYVDLKERATSAEGLDTSRLANIDPNRIIAEPSPAPGFDDIANAEVDAAEVLSNSEESSTLPELDGAAPAPTDAAPDDLRS